MSARGPDGQVVATSLAKADIHDEWEARYRQADILALQDRAFDRALEVAQPAPGSEFLDAGCGTGFNAIRLARKGFTVRAVDFSEVILSSARANVTASGYADRISVSPGDLTRLDLGDASVDNILCWGVLMHVPELQGAMSELTRVLRPGGKLIVCEGNMYAADELALRILDRFGRTTSRRRVPSGGAPTSAGSCANSRLEASSCAKDWRASSPKRTSTPAPARMSAGRSNASTSRGSTGLGLEPSRRTTSSSCRNRRVVFLSRRSRSRSSPRTGTSHFAVCRRRASSPRAAAGTP